MLKRNNLIYIFLLIILVLAAVNLFTLVPIFIRSIERLKNGPTQTIGGAFVPLVPYVRNIPSAGFMTCQESTHPLTDVAVMGPYQQAQFVLSPVILDYYHPLDHSHIVLYCPAADKQKQIVERLRAHVIYKTRTGSLLLERRGF